MDALTIHHLVYLALLNLLIIALGYRAIPRRVSWQSWVMLVVSVFIIHLIFLNDHPIIRMLALIATAFTAMKVIATVASYKGSLSKLTFFKWLVFVIGWAGMRAQPFEKLGDAALPDGWPNIKIGVTRIAAGFLFIIFAHVLMGLQMQGEIPHFIITAILFVAFSLVLHFGWLRVSMGLWRLCGVYTYSLFRAPFRASSMREFWSRRWNIAFSEMTSIALFRPLKNTIGGTWASMVAFVFSGLLHELAISLPVNNGYGLPLLYFVIQGGGVIVERELLRRKAKFLEHSLFSRIWTCLWLVVPLPLLFHSYFVEGVIWPIAGLSYG